MAEFLIRPVRLADVVAIHRIYSNSVLTETASWELVPPTLEEMRQRLQGVLDGGFPYFVATLDEQVVGYSYASHYRPRPGYRFVVEDSIYVDPAYQRRGIARRLVSTVIDACTAQGKRQMIAVIGDSQNQASITLHRSLGFQHTVCLPSIGYKFGRWLDSVIMQRALGAGDTTLPEEL